VYIEGDVSYEVGYVDPEQSRALREQTRTLFLLASQGEFKVSSTDISIIDFIYWASRARDNEPHHLDILKLRRWVQLLKMYSHLRR